VARPRSRAAQPAIQAAQPLLLAAPPHPPAVLPLPAAAQVRAREHRQHGCESAWLVADLGLGCYVGKLGHGCVWTGVDCKSNCSAGIVAVPNSTTSITPLDFTAATKEGGRTSHWHRVQRLQLGGSSRVRPDRHGEWRHLSSVAARTNPAADGPPAIGYALWHDRLCDQLERQNSASHLVPHPDQGVKGATDPTNRWCATITDASGPSFVKYSDFYPSCWYVASPARIQARRTLAQPIDSVVFLVPGTIAAKRRRFTIVGFAPGTSTAQALVRLRLRHNDWHGRHNNAIVWPAGHRRVDAAGGGGLERTARNTSSTTNNWGE